MNGNASGDLSNVSLLEMFRVEAESQSAVFTDGLLALERDPRAVERLEPLMRAAHSIKGSALVMNLATLAKLAHAMEDCFVAAQRGKLELRQNHIDLLLEGVDFLTRVCQVPETEMEILQQGAKG